MTQLQLPSPPKHYDLQDQAQTRRLIAQAISVLQTFTNVSNTTTIINQTGNLTSVKDYGAVGDGVTDDTVSLQTAFDGGLPLFFPPGIYIVSSTLNITSYANCGQIIYGSGSYYSIGSVGFSTTPPPNTSVIRASAAMTKVFLIDGTPIGGYQTTWVQGFGLENICIDMTNMADDASVCAINQIQAFDCHYTNVRIINDGDNKRGWIFSAGAFVSQLNTCQCNILEFTGLSGAYGVTTINVFNHDGGKVVSGHAGSLKFIGGAFQGAGTKFYLRDSFDIELKCDVEGSGIFLDVDTSVSYLRSECELQGFSGTYMSGTIGNASKLWDQQVNFNTYPSAFTQGYIHLNNQGLSSGDGRSSFLSGASNVGYYLYLGRASGESIWAVAGVPNDWLGGTLAGDTIIGANNGGESTWIQAAGVAAAKATSTGFNTYGTGTLNQGTVNCTTMNCTGVATVGGTLLANAYVSQPVADGQQFTLENVAGQVYYIASSNATIANAGGAFGNGAKLSFFSDNFVTRTILLDGASGNITATGEVLVGASTTARASLNLPHGTAPTSPVNGDLWTTTAGVYGQVNGSTVGPFGAVTANVKTKVFGTTFGDTLGAALTSGSIVYMTCPFAGTISAWNICVDAGTVTIDIWKIASGTAVPTVANTITAAASPALSANTAARSTTLTGWSTTATANDNWAFQLTAVATAKFVSITVEIDQ